MLRTGTTYDFHRKMCNNNTFFHCLYSALMEKHDFIVLSSLGTVHVLCSSGIVFFYFLIIS
jgi:hypothetical protein